MKYTLRVWCIINVPNHPVRMYVESPAEAKAVIDKMADAQLDDPEVFTNAFGLEEWDGEEWTEWYSDDGEDIDNWEPKSEEFQVLVQFDE